MNFKGFGSFISYTMLGMQFCLQLVLFSIAGIEQCFFCVYQDQPVAAERGCVYAPSKITTSPQKTERIVGHIPTQCSISHQSNPVMMKFRRKLTEVDEFTVFFPHGLLLLLTY